MIKKKFTPELLKEELKRFRMISEYSFFQEESNPDNLILGTELEEADEDPSDEATDDSKTAQDTGEESADKEQSSDDENLFDSDEEDSEESPEDTSDEEAPEESPEDMGDEEAPEESPEDMGAEEPDEDEVEVDVTQLVKSGEETKAAAGSANQKTDELLSKFSELEQKLARMGKITDKIEALEKEIIKRNPTPVEKLEMRSMDSFPYNIKLTDYWKDVDGYETGNEKDKPKEYVLTRDDIDSYTDTSIKDTFNVPDYEEEDV